MVSVTVTVSSTKELEERREAADISKSDAYKRGVMDLLFEIDPDNNEPLTEQQTYRKMKKYQKLCERFAREIERLNKYGQDNSKR